MRGVGEETSAPRPWGPQPGAKARAWGQRINRPYLDSEALPVYHSETPFFKLGDLPPQDLQMPRLEKADSCLATPLLRAKVGLCRWSAVGVPAEQSLCFLGLFSSFPQEVGEVAIDIGQASSPGVAGHSAFLICYLYF